MLRYIYYFFGGPQFDSALFVLTKKGIYFLNSTFWSNNRFTRLFSRYFSVQILFNTLYGEKKASFKRVFSKSREKTFLCSSITLIVLFELQNFFFFCIKSKYQKIGCTCIFFFFFLIEHSIVNCISLVIADKTMHLHKE